MKIIPSLTTHIGVNIKKTKLIGLYVNKYGFSQYGRQLAIEKEDAVQLIQKYL